jgi:putative glycosyltransferase (TIGR04372 family)
MGAVKAEPLDICSDNYVDYAANGMRTEMLDVFLSANCSFFISTGTGLDSLARVFRKPLVLTNLSQVDNIQLTVPSLTILKRFYHSDGPRLLNLRELNAMNLFRLRDNEQLRHANVFLEDNTPSELLAVTKEMLQRVRGDWQETPDENELHQCLLTALPEYMSQGPALGRVGYQFMSTNRWLYA